MNRVLRSCFDPLPRFMTMKSLACVVAMVVLGTGISVYEYLESSVPPQRPLSRAQPSESVNELRAPPAKSMVLNSLAPAHSTRASLDDEHSRSNERGPTCGSAPQSRSIPPSVWEPPVEQTGN